MWQFHEEHFVIVFSTYRLVLMGVFSVGGPHTRIPSFIELCNHGKNTHLVKKCSNYQSDFDKSWIQFALAAMTFFT